MRRLTPGTTLTDKLCPYTTLFRSITLKGGKSDLSKVKVPSCLISTREDHIAPWKATYSATRLLGGPVKFILAGSGHIAGVVNPPEAQKYGYWTNASNPETPEAWCESAETHGGSWWPAWNEWVAEFGNGKVPADRKSTRLNS